MSGAAASIAATPVVPDKAVERVLRHAREESGFLFLAVNSGPPENGLVAYYARLFEQGFGEVIATASEGDGIIFVYPTWTTSPDLGLEVAQSLNSLRRSMHSSRHATLLRSLEAMADNFAHGHFLGMAGGQPIYLQQNIARLQWMAGRLFQRLWQTDLVAYASQQKLILAECRHAVGQLSSQSR